MLNSQKSRGHYGLALLGVLYLGMSTIGFTWGLPDSAWNQYLYTEGEYLLVDEPTIDDSAARDDTSVGADVDINPRDLQDGVIALNDTPAEQAEIYRRFRLFTRQPDEMITMMALSGMSPSQLQFDPKLYQYGGLFVYPVGLLIRVAGWLGIVEVSGDPAYYLAHPEAFARFYWVARAYVASWGFAGIALMFAIGRRLGGPSAGVMSAALFVLLPVVTSMSHEAKPHLPGAVLMLAAVWFAVRALDRQTFGDWAGLFIACGAAVGMVLSSIPIVILVPLTLGLHCRNQHKRQVHELPPCSNRHVDYRPVFLRATTGGLLVTGFVYLLTNPYVGINLFCNRSVLHSNFGNSVAMYEVTRVFEGFVRVIQLTIEGTTIPIAILGTIAAIAAVVRKTRTAIPLWVAAGLFALQFVLIGAGKPDEYGRFGIFYGCALAIGTACFVAYVYGKSKWAGATLGTITCSWCVLFSTGYLWSFYADAAQQGSRDIAAKQLIHESSFAVIAEPAPYACPPTNFATARVTLYRNSATEPVADRVKRWTEDCANQTKASAAPPKTMLAIVDHPEKMIEQLNLPKEFSTQILENRPDWLPRSNISWANKPVLIIKAP